MNGLSRRGKCRFPAWDEGCLLECPRDGRNAKGVIFGVAIRRLLASMVPLALIAHFALAFQVKPAGFVDFVAALAGFSVPFHPGFGE